MNAKQRSASRQSVWRVLENVRNQEGKYMMRIETIGRKGHPAGQLMPTLDEQCATLAEMASNIRTADRYAEPGYDLADDKVMILFGNWNGVTRWSHKLNDILTVEPLSTVWNELTKWLGDRCELEWEDEWDTCSVCGGAFRTSPNCYGWMQSYIPHDDGIICHECIEGDPERYLDWWIGDHRKAITNEMINPEDFGFVRLKDQCEHGFHRGQDAITEKMAGIMRSRGVKRFLFTIDGAGQFDITFSLWVHKEELGQAGKLTDDDINGPSMAAAMERSLHSASLYSPDPEPDKDGVIYRKVDLATGNITTRKISPQEWVEKGIS